MLRTPAMKDAFSHIDTRFLVSHCPPSRSTALDMRRLYLASCSSAFGTLRRHSSMTLSFCRPEKDFTRSPDLRTLSLCFWIEFDSFSRRCGRDRFSSKSKTVRRSSGGRVSSRSEKEPDLDRPGEGGVVPLAEEGDSDRWRPLTLGAR